MKRLLLWSFFAGSTVAADLIMEEYTRAWALSGTRETWPQAIEELKRIVEKHPRFDRAFDTLASVYSRSGRVMEGEAYFRALVSQGPRSPWAHLALARIYGQQGRDQEVVSELNRCLVMDTEAFACLPYLAGYLRVVLKRFPTPQDVRTHTPAVVAASQYRCLFWGVSYLGQRRMNELQESIDKCRETASKSDNQHFRRYVHVDYRMVQGMHESQLSRRLESTLGQLAQAESTGDLQGKLDALHHLYAIHLALGETERVHQTLENLWKSAHHSGSRVAEAQARVVHAYYAQHRGDFDEAIRLHLEAVQLQEVHEPGMGHLHSLMEAGKLMQETGDLAGARSTFERLVDRSKSYSGSSWMGHPGECRERARTDSWNCGIHVTGADPRRRDRPTKRFVLVRDRSL